ncbi:MAG: Hsp20/alpha crystallin family protein [Anaerolineales bacterium]
MRRVIYRRPRTAWQTRQGGVSFNGGRRLPVDVLADDDRFTVIAEVPGFEADEVEIELEEDVLTLSVKPREQESEGVQARALWQERHSGEMSRRIRLLKPVNRDEIEAWVENGILTIDLPLAEEIRPRQIEVRAR